MKILTLASEIASGGAGIAAWRLHNGLSARGVESVIYTPDRRLRDSAVKIFEPHSLALSEFELFCAETAKSLSLQYFFLPASFSMFRWKDFKSADALQIHNIHAQRPFFSPTALPFLTGKIPAIWTLHDFWPFTGHCTVSAYGNCEKWRTGCGSCPALSEYPGLKRDTTGFLCKWKRGIYRRSRISFAAPSKWMACRASESPLAKTCEIRWIPNGLDLGVFRPRPKSAMRGALGIPENEPVVLFVSPNLDDPIKGASTLMKSLFSLRRALGKSFTAVVAGPKGVAWQSVSEFRVIMLGRVAGDEMLAALYSAADVFALPPNAENFPNTVVEALACGTPVVAFDVGGVREAVRHMETGLLAKPGDSEEFAVGLYRVLTNAELRKKLSENALSVARAEYSIELMASRYARYYEDAISASRKGRP